MSAPPASVMETTTPVITDIENLGILVERGLRRTFYELWFARKWPCRSAIAPTGLAGTQPLSARAAKKFGIPFTLSAMSICSLEDVDDSVERHPFWLQLYVRRDHGFMRSLIERADDWREMLPSRLKPERLSFLSLCQTEASRERVLASTKGRCV